MPGLAGPGGGIGAPGGATTARGASGGFWGGVGSFAKDNWQNIAAMGASAYSAYRTNKQSRQLSQRQMDFQERMSNTAYQRSAEDLSKAGLNRILAIGSPATTPAGSQPPKLEVPGRHAREGIATAMQVAQIKAQIRLTEAQTGLTTAQTGAVEPGIQRTRAQTNLTTTQAVTESLRQVGINTQNDIAKLDREIKQLNMQEVHSKETFFKWLRTATVQEKDYWLSKIYGQSSLGTLQKWLGGLVRGTYLKNEASNLDQDYYDRD